MKDRKVDKTSWLLNVWIGSFVMIRIGSRTIWFDEFVIRVLDEIDTISGKRANEGLNEFNFTLGVCNCVSFVFAMPLSHTHTKTHTLCTEECCS